MDNATKENPPFVPPTSSEPTLPFSRIFHLLASYYQTQNSLDLPLMHPTTQSILSILSSLGIQELLQEQWETNYQQLKQYKSDYGNCTVTVTSTASQNLEQWTTMQKECCKNYELKLQQQQYATIMEEKMLPMISKERYLKLKELGLMVNKWEKRLLELQQYKMDMGHVDVPIDHSGGLGIWCATQRETYKYDKDIMPIERIEALGALGFIWNIWGQKRSKARVDAWDKMFHELMEYKHVNGDCNISQYDENNKQLGKWAKNQRYEYRRYHNKGLGQSRISRDRIQKLESIGFQWRLKPEKVSWEERFEQLKQFKAENGHCRPPQNHPKIGSWTKYQRNQLQYFQDGKPSKVDQEKVDKLLSIGFNDPPPTRTAAPTDALLLLENPEVAQRKRAARRAKRKKTRESQNQQMPSPTHDAHNPQAYQPYPDQNMPQYPTQYDFDPNAGLDNYYQAYDQHGNPVLQDANGQSYYQGYDQFQAGV